MRDILLRGKSIKTNEWAYGFLLTNVFGDYMIQEKDSKIWVSGIDTRSLGQFTGLHDKNNQEIFEGDICKYSDDEEGDCFDPVVFLNGAFRINNKVLDISYAKEIEIVGNFYDNKEILKEE